MSHGLQELGKQLTQECRKGMQKEFGAGGVAAAISGQPDDERHTTSTRFFKEFDRLLASSKGSLQFIPRFHRFTQFTQVGFRFQRLKRKRLILFVVIFMSMFRKA